MTSTAKAVSSLSLQVHQNTSFDFASLFTILFPLLLRLPCFSSEEQTPAEFLASRYDAKRDRYRPMILRRAREETQRAALQDGRGELSNKELDLLTKAVFDKARLEPELSTAVYLEHKD